MENAQFLAALPTEQRLALAYARRSSRRRLLGFFALDARLAGIVRKASEPLLGQMQLAWWRERLAMAPELRPRGEPLLGLLANWGGEGEALAGLAEGWELLLDEAPLGREALAAHAAARARGWAALARQLGVGAEAEVLRIGRNWALADLAARLGAGEEHRLALDLARQQDWSRARLPRDLRPLTVLHGLARRRRGEAPLLDGPWALGAALRLGIIGR